MIKIHFPNPESQIPKEFKSEFSNLIAETNWHRYYYFSIAIAFCMVLLILIPDLNAYKDGLFSSFKAYTYFFEIHLAFLFQAILFLALYKKLNSLLASKKLTEGLLNFIVLVNICIIIILVALLAIVSQSVHGAIDSYTVGILIVASGLFINFPSAFLLFGLAHIGFVFGIIEFQRDAKLASSHIANGSTMVMLALFLNQVFFFVKKKDFLKNKIIEKQAIALEEKANELERINASQQTIINSAKTILEQTNQIAKIGGWEFDLERNTGYWSNLTKEIFEVDFNFEPELKSMYSYISDDKIKIEVIGFIQGKYNVRNYIDKEFQIFTAKGNIIWIRMVGKFSSDLGTNKIFGTIQDISENKKVEKELEKAKAEAENANKAKSSFIANMSHEIRTPLNSIMGFTEILLQSNLNTNQSRYLKIILQSSFFLKDLVNDILDFSKFEAGKLRLNIERTDIYQLIEDSVNLIKLRAHENENQIKINVSKALPKYIWLDPIRVKQVLLNLLSNSVKFTIKGEIELKVELENSPTESTDDLENLNILFSVRDTGIGIAEENFEKIFEAFSQVNFSVTQNYEGAGLGLSISNMLISLMNSKLKLKTKVGIGSEFYFTIKAKGEHDIVFSKETEKYPTKVFFHSNTSSRSFKLLIVDDNSANRELLKIFLNIISPYFNIVEAQNGKEAVEVFKQENPSLIFMDIQMPIMNGIEATKRIRTLEKTHRIPIIALTANLNTRETENFLSQDLDDFIPKPISQNNIENAMQKWLYQI